MTSKKPSRLPKARRSSPETVKSGRGAATGSTAKARAKPRSRLDVAVRREQLLTVGRELFLERPYDQVSMDDVAAGAHVSKALVFHYFASKRDLYVEVVRGAAVELLTATEVSDPDPMTQLRVGLRRYLDYVEANARGYVALLTGGVGVDPEVLAVVEGVRQVLASRISERLPKGSASKLVVRGFIGFVEAASLEWIAHGRGGADELVSLFERVLAATLSAPRG